jgi:hypothetical protein
MELVPLKRTIQPTDIVGRISSEKGCFRWPFNSVWIGFQYSEVVIRAFLSSDINNISSNTS